VRDVELLYADETSWKEHSKLLTNSRFRERRVAALRRLDLHVRLIYSI